MSNSVVYSDASERPRSAADQDFARISVTHDLVYGFSVCHWLCQCSVS
jgi:hypothetical protein